MLLLLDEYSHPTEDHLLRKSASLPLFNCRTADPRQSGQSLIEHSYKADSDLSQAGWDYADRLKAAVVARRKALREERKARGEVLAEENPLLVCPRAQHRHSAVPC